MWTVEKTERGFDLVEFGDHNGVKCSLQQSSAIDPRCEHGLEHPGSSLLWLGCDNHPSSRTPTRMHLNKNHVAWLVKTLGHWLKWGTLDMDQELPPAATGACHDDSDET